MSNAKQTTTSEVRHYANGSCRVIVRDDRGTRWDVRLTERELQQVSDLDAECSFYAGLSEKRLITSLRGKRMIRVNGNNWASLTNKGVDVVSALRGES